jgi:NAD(P)-dependent dehydrogenase (short-subunit alcohol dehydrogenase family)
MAIGEFDIEGRTVIVTGAARGIGKGIVRVLAEAGARVLVTALTDRYLNPLGEELASAGHPIETLVADATSADDWQGTLDRALGLWGRIDVLINSLGDAIRKPVVPLPGSSGEGPLTDDEWRRVIDINLTQAFMGCRAIGPHFLERRRGKVINISGFAARKGAPELLAYSAAKAGVARLTQTLALEWAPYGITVNSIAPGYFPDPETNDPAEVAERRELAKTAVPLGRVGELREVGLLALYLVSDASNYLTGETIFLDGGATFA